LILPLHFLLDLEKTNTSIPLWLIENFELVLNEIAKVSQNQAILAEKLNGMSKI